MGEGKSMQNKINFPQFSWSYSRGQTLIQCPRKYYYEYYGSYIGKNDPDGHQMLKAAYRLKHLTNIPNLLGSIVHEANSWVIERYIGKRNLLTKADYQKFIQNKCKFLVTKMNIDDWWQNPTKHIMLKEIYKHKALSEAEFDEIAIRSEVCANNFYNSQTLSEIIKGNISIEEIEKLNNKLLLDETKIFVKIDLLFEKNSKWVIVDWKTGRDTGEERKQLLIYALYVWLVRKVPVQNIELRIENVFYGTCTTFQTNTAELEGLIFEIKENQTLMEKLLKDKESNRPRPMDDFKLLFDQCKCHATCNYYSLCSN